jgi:glycine/D-amino acid oxidase-like deaminating enzyme
MTPQYDVIILGAGIAGLWLGNTLKRAGYHVIVVENDKIGSGQTLASQGMIHGGQKYALTGKVAAQAASISAMPERWEAALGGWGEIDLTSVKAISDHQLMWPAGAALSTAAVYAAAKLVNAKTKKLSKDDWPEILSDRPKFKGPVYRLPEKVLDVRSLMQALMQPLKGRVFKGQMTEILPDGQVALAGRALQAQVVIAAAGKGNEDVFRLMKIGQQHTQRRPLRQIMVRGAPARLFGHGIVGNPKPRLTVTTHDDGAGGHVWYLGGAVAENSVTMTESESISFAQRELADVFPQVNWNSMDYATWLGDRAEPFDAAGHLPPGPFLHQRGHVLLAWPTKLTFVPALSDRVMAFLKDKDITPRHHDVLPDFPSADIASYPWETASWQRQT